MLNSVSKNGKLGHVANWHRGRMIYGTDLLSASHSPVKIVLAKKKIKHFKEQHCCSYKPWLIRQLSVRAAELGLGGGGGTQFPNYFLCSGPIRQTLIMGLFAERTRVFSTL